MKRLLSLMLLLMVVASCTTPPRAHQVESATVIAKPMDAVWSNIMRYFTSSQIQIRTVERDSGIVYAESARTTTGTILDCGTVNDQPIAGIATLNVFVDELSPEETSVTVNVAGRGSYLDPLNARPVDVDCNSTGRLETTILEAAAGGV